MVLLVQTDIDQETIPMSDKPFVLTCLACDAGEGFLSGKHALDAGWANVQQFCRQSGGGPWTHVGECPEHQETLTPEQVIAELRVLLLGLLQNAPGHLLANVALALQGKSTAVPGFVKYVESLTRSPETRAVVYERIGYATIDAGVGQAPDAPPAETAGPYLDALAAIRDMLHKAFQRMDVSDYGIVARALGEGPWVRGLIRKMTDASMAKSVRDAIGLTE
jgi:hypothetical protein